MSTTLANFLIQARQNVGDGPTDNLARLESLNQPDSGGIINGTNVNFVFKNFPVVDPAVGGLTTVYVDGVLIPSSGYTLNEATGEIVFNVAPTESAIVSYYYYLMTDTAWTNFTQDALRRINISTGVPATDILGVPDPLIAALSSYAGGAWARRIAGQSGLWYNQRLQERQEDRDSISKKFMQMSEALFKDGDIARDDFYKGDGAQFKPAMTIINHTPRNVTPSR